VYDASDGYSFETFTHHSLSMHIGQPVLVTSACDGAQVHRLQVPGDLKVVPAGYSRVWEIAAPTSKLVVDLAPWFVREIADEMSIPADRAVITPQLHLHDKRIEHIGWALLEELQSDDPLGRLYAESLGSAIASHLLRRSAPVTPSRVTGLPKRRLQRVYDYVREHISQELSLQELAAVAGLSNSYFNVQFRESTGMPVHQYVISMRVAYALDMLVRTSLPVADVALQSGFSNQSHLSLHMRRLHGVTPAAVRRQML
jgi:AraC family transcriptional regulator